MIASCINTLSRCVSSGVTWANVCTCAPISSALRATTSNNSLSAFVTFNSIQSPVRPIGTVSRLIVTGLMVLGLTCVEPCETTCGFPLGKTGTLVAGLGETRSGLTLGLIDVSK